MPHREPVHGKVRLTMRINDTDYLMTFLHPDPAVANPAWRLSKQDGSGVVYDVHLDRNGASCTCPDFVFCREHRDPAGCKHIAAMRARGLFWYWREA